MLTEIIVALILLFLSAFFISAEISFLALRKSKISEIIQKKNFSSLAVEYFLKTPFQLLYTKFSSLAIMNLSIAVLSLLIFVTIFQLNYFIVILLTSLIILIIQLFMSKIFAGVFDGKISALVLRFFSVALSPLIKLISVISNLFFRIFGLKKEVVEFSSLKEEIEILTKESDSFNFINKKEKDIITRISGLSDQRVYEVMRPRTEIVGVESDQTIAEIIGIFIDSGYSKLPVYEDNLDNIKGVILARDLFKMPENLQSIIREVVFIPETKRSLETLNEFLKKEISIAIVIDEFGGTAGLITTEDLVEELFGEIKDEYDVEEYICKRISGDSFIISGKVEIDIINEKFNLGLPEGEYETIGGFVTDHLSRIPQNGEIIQLDKFSINIIRATSTKIELVKLSKTGD
jgi:CBS domain containing-hemolysin-like protein